MATVWYDHYAQCPYYQRSDSKKTVTCQGVDDASKLCWRFEQTEDLMIQLKTFCCGRYKNCEVYQMLKGVYEDNDNG